MMPISVIDIIIFVMILSYVEINYDEHIAGGIYSIVLFSFLAGVIITGIRMILILENDNTNIKYISNENNESFDESEEDSFDTDDDETQTKITEYYK